MLCFGTRGEAVKRRITCALSLERADVGPLNIEACRLNDYYHACERMHGAAKARLVAASMRGAVDFVEGLTQEVRRGGCIDARNACVGGQIEWLGCLKSSGGAGRGSGGAYRRAGREGLLLAVPFCMGRD